MRGFKAIIPVVLAHVLTGCAGSEFRLCAHITMKDHQIRLNGNERVLVCGAEGGGEGWRQVPLPQAEYELRGILQNQGYLHPHFERHDGQLDVWAGNVARISDLQVTGGGGLVDPARKRQTVGEPLTSEKLDEVKNWAELNLKSAGYACPKVAVRAQGWDGRVIADIDAGQVQRIGGIDYSGLDGLDVQSLARHQAMQPGDIYDVRETQLTASRMLNDALFQTAYFTETCHGDKVDLHLVTAIGKPRILRFGVGASTEEFPFASLWFRDARLDARASSFTAALYVSPRRQSVDLGSEFYKWPWSKRSFLGPRLYSEHVREPAYEVNRARLGIDVGRLWDMWKTRFRGRVGPTFNYENTVRGLGPHESAFLSWDGALIAMSRDYELFARDRYSGWQGEFDYRGQRRGVGSPINVDRFELSARHLWNIGGYGPPLFVFGTRAQGVVVNYSDLTASPGNERELLPIDDRVYFGGDENLRGFARKSLDNGGRGYLTALYFGTELRLIEELPYHLQPYLLFDVGQLGDRRLTLDPAVFLSEGIGLRWPSFFGTLRGSIARGTIVGGDEAATGYRQQWVAFIGFGQEF